MAGCRNSQNGIWCEQPYSSYMINFVIFWSLRPWKLNINSHKYSTELNGASVVLWLMSLTCNWTLLMTFWIFKWWRYLATLWNDHSMLVGLSSARLCTNNAPRAPGVSIQQWSWTALTLTSLLAEGRKIQRTTTIRRCLQRYCPNEHPLQCRNGTYYK